STPPTDRVRDQETGPVRAGFLCRSRAIGAGRGTHMVFRCPGRRSYCGGMAAPGAPAFRGRAGERRMLDRLLDRIRGGEGAVLVIRGEAGIGKTALLHYCARQAAGCRVAQLAGVESELELPFAALHQLCAPLLGDLAALP